MRLVTRLIVSHTLLPAALIGLLAFMLMAIMRMDGLIDQVRVRYLDTIDKDEQLHRAAWALEVAMRHGTAACDDGADDRAVAAQIGASLAGLREVERRVGPAAAQPIRDAVERYEIVAAQAIEGGTCARLRAPENRSERTDLDERLTSAWMSQLRELHRDVQVTGGQLRAIGGRAIDVGVAAGILSLLAAALLAQRMARSVTAPLSE